ncbi:MAG: DUF2948 family protein [Parvularculaceae bacterium]
MTGLRNYKALKLIANDADDLKVLSACLQDAVAKMGDFAFLSDERRFVFVANRFVWEAGADHKVGPFARVRTGAHFNDVLSIKHHHLRTDAQDAVVELLAIRFDPGEDGGGAIVLDFAGGGAIRLDVESVNAQMADISDPWPTRSKPKHDGA